MATYEIVNPSDPYTMEADDVAVAAFAVTLFGAGQYPLVDKATGETAVPPFMFGGFDEWWRVHSDVATGDFLDDEARKAAVLAALDSVTLQSKCRSSMNDIGRAARSIAAQIRGESGKVKATP